ncbi:expressed protein [Phakopsora pachyrhizi]|uniref:Expressed protein n=1 Tax=Phakopsora pachyrhizi TaxID=170000 RepID=A0AAV0B4P1_PHAPC|nr:expressed protein [Phakopsora pachyrhizi]
MLPPHSINRIHAQFDRSKWPRADPNSDKFELLRPRDGAAESIVNEMFDDMMRRRELASLPPAAKQDMLNFSLEKKWTLIYNDRYTELDDLLKHIVIYNTIFEKKS